MRRFHKRNSILHGGPVWIRSARMVLHEPQIPRPVGERVSFTSLGGYTLVHLTNKGAALCAVCANKATDVAEVAIHYEGRPLRCYRCGATMESAYGDPWARGE